MDFATASTDGFLVQRKLCATCIYKPGLGWNIEHLENQVREYRADGLALRFFAGYRLCHHTKNKDDVCCRGFWDRHKNKFQKGQLAQRFGLVRFVDREKDG